MIQLVTFTVVSTRAVITTGAVFTTLARLGCLRKTTAMSFLCAGTILTLTIDHSGSSSKTINRHERGS